DYKTGNVDSIVLQEMEELFENNRKKPKKEILQALIYSFIYKKNYSPKQPLTPAIYSLSKLFGDNFNPSLRKEKAPLVFQDIEDEFFARLQELITEMFSPATEFVQTPHESACVYCAYNKICQR